MPIVTIQVTREGTTLNRYAPTAEEKAELIKGVSGWGGLPVPEFRRRRAASQA